MVVDSIDASLTIGADEFFVINTKVVHSDYKNSNYAEIKCYPSPSVEIPTDITEFRGRSATLTCDTTLSEKRNLLRQQDAAGDTSIEPDNLLFSGNVARIYRAGDGSIDVVLFDPGQSLFESFSGREEDEVSSISRLRPGDEGFEQVSSSESSIQNGEISLVQPSGEDGGGSSETVLIKAKDVVTKVLNDIGVADREITLAEGGTTFTVNGQEFTGAYNRELYFENTEWNAHELLKEVERRTESTFNFKKDGTFKFGVPEIRRHKLFFVTETTAGIKSPPYQSVKVIGTGIRSDSDNIDNPGVVSENKIVKKRALKPSVNGSERIEEGQTKEPVYTYKSADLVTDTQVESTADQIINEIKSQQKGGEITVIGYPEITLNDTLIVPEEFGGEAYTATKITHRINSSDGFTTKINVTAPIIPDRLGGLLPVSDERRGRAAAGQSTSLGLDENEEAGNIVDQTVGRYNELEEEFEQSAEEDDTPVGRRGPDDAPLEEVVSEGITSVSEAIKALRGTITPSDTNEVLLE